MIERRVACLRTNDGHLTTIYQSGSIYSNFLRFGPASLMMKMIYLKLLLIVDCFVSTLKYEEYWQDRSKSIFVYDRSGVGYDLALLLLLLVKAKMKLKLRLMLGIPMHQRRDLNSKASLAASKID